MILKMKAVLVLIIFAALCVAQASSTTTQVTYETINITSSGEVKTTSQIVNVQNMPGNCYANCSTSADCGGASADCNTCVQGVCTCAHSLSPCLNLDFTSTGWFRYSCLNTSNITVCKQGAYDQPAGLCDYTCPLNIGGPPLSDEACCDTRYGSTCLNPHYQYCCAEQNSQVPTPCPQGWNCSASPTYGNVQAVCVEPDRCNPSPCGGGFTCSKYYDWYQCIDIDECLDPSACSYGFKCVNDYGGFWCTYANACTDGPPPCPDGFHCVDNWPEHYCYDVDECTYYYNPPICGSGYTCQNTNGSYICNDINECDKNACGTGFTCNNTIGAYKCTDIDECALSLYNCSSGHVCHNTNGSYTCADINECAQTPSVCKDGEICTNTDGGYVCTSDCLQTGAVCPSGFTCNTTQAHCVDINECLTNSSACAAGYSCQNTVGSFMCNDVNECLNNPCNAYCTCNNTIGSYFCNPLPFYICTMMPGSNLVLEPLGNASVPGTAVGMQTKVIGKQSQLWKYSTDNYIYNVASDLVIDISGGSATPSAQVILWPKKTSSWALNQNWLYNASTHAFRSAAGPVVLDVYHNDFSVGAPLCVYTNFAQLNQQFTLQSGL